MSFIQVPTDGVGKKVQTSVVNVDEHRQHVVFTDSTDVSGVAKIVNTDPAVTAYAIATREVGRTLKSFNLLVSVSGDNTIVAAVIGKKIKVVWFSIQNQHTASLDVKWKSSTTSDLIGPLTLDPHEGWGEKGRVREPVAETVAGEALTLNLSGAGNVRVFGRYYDDDAS